jgi:uncharacterized protein YodC (DUF2158 family)
MEREMAMAFNVGDVVQLTCGGAPMTVTAVGPADVECSWFERDRFRSRIFGVDAVMVAKRTPTLEELVLESLKVTVPPQA